MTHIALQAAPTLYRENTSSQFPVLNVKNKKSLDLWVEPTASQFIVIKLYARKGIGWTELNLNPDSARNWLENSYISSLGFSFLIRKKKKSEIPMKPNEMTRVKAQCMWKVSHEILDSLLLRQPRVESP